MQVYCSDVDETCLQHYQQHQNILSFQWGTTVTATNQVPRWQMWERPLEVVSSGQACFKQSRQISSHGPTVTGFVSCVIMLRWSCVKQGRKLYYSFW